MRFVTFQYDNNSEPRFGFKKNDQIIDIVCASNWIYQSKNDSRFLDIPSSLKQALKDWTANFDKIKELDGALSNHDLLSVSEGEFQVATLETNVRLLPPVTNPRSFRDFYAFRKHVEAGRKSRGLDMIEEYDEFPVFYFSNHNCIFE